MSEASQKDELTAALKQRCKQLEDAMPKPKTDRRPYSPNTVVLTIKGSVDVVWKPRGINLVINHVHEERQWNWTALDEVGKSNTRR